MTISWVLLRACCQGRERVNADRLGAMGARKALVIRVRCPHVILTILIQFVVLVDLAFVEVFRRLHSIPSQSLFRLK